MKSTYGLGMALLVAAGSAQPAMAADASSIWKDAVKKCAANALQGHGTVFLGLSSSYAPGTVFRRLAHGRVQIQSRASDYISEQDRAGVVLVNPPVSCASVAQKSFKVSGSVDLSQLVPATVGFDVSRAKTVTVQPATIAWEELVLRKYEDLVTTQAPATIRQDLLVSHLPVLMRAVRVDGIKTTLTFDASTGVNLSKLPIPAGIEAKWTSSTQLTISSAATFYIAGQLSSFEGTSLQSSGRKSLKPDTNDSVLVTP